MNHRKKILILLGGLACLPILAIASAYFNNYIICTSYSCYDFLYNEKYVFFTFTPLFISASLLPLLIFSKRVFNIWKKFAMVAIPLMIIGILLVKVSPVACGNLICVNRTFMIFFTGYLYLALSIIVTFATAMILPTQSVGK